MMDRHPEIAILPEPWWMVRLMKRLASESRPLTRGLATGHLAAQVPPPWLVTAGLAVEDAVAQLPAGHMCPAEVVSAVGRAYATRAGKPRWGAKYPGAEFRRALPLMRDVYPEATFVFLARDVRDVYLSQISAGLRRGTGDLYLYCLLWALQTDRILDELGRMGGRGLVVRYEDLVEAPEKTLRRICDAAGLAATAEVLKRMLDHQQPLQGQVTRNPIHQNVQGPVLAANRRKFESRLSPEQIRRTEVIARAALGRLGYGDGWPRPRVTDGVSLAAQIPLRLAVNAWRSYRGRSTLSGMELRGRRGS
jgi:hypothetical protein